MKFTKNQAIIAFVLGIIIILTVFIWFKKANLKTIPGEQPKVDSGTLTIQPTETKKNTVVIETVKGTIKFTFYEEDAPKTVERLRQLVSEGFYNDAVFHRVVPDFVIQGGDPLCGKNGVDHPRCGTGGSGKNIPAEFNKQKHVLGTVAMARSNDPNSADSQFYICLGEIPHLDGKYTIFGQVNTGIDVVKKIVRGDKMTKVYLE